MQGDSASHRNPWRAVEPSTWLLIVAAFGAIVPNGIFGYWLIREFSSVREVLANKLAVAFMLDALMATLLLAWLFAIRPPGRIRWPWFLLFSFLGGLGFSIPFYLWLNGRRDTETPGPSLSAAGGPHGGKGPRRGQRTNSA